MAQTHGTDHNNTIKIRRLIKMEAGTTKLPFRISRYTTRHLQKPRNRPNIYMKVVPSFPKSEAQSMLSCQISKVRHMLSYQT